jgi:hypothetical protein
MYRYIAGGVAVLLLVGAGFFFWMGRAGRENPIPPAPKAGIASTASGEEEAQEAGDSASPPPVDERSREQKRFDRADKDKDGRITLAERLEPRRKPFTKLDANGDGRLSFEEWTLRTRDQFAQADKDRDGNLTRAEFATTKPKRTAKARCACGSAEKSGEGD